MYILNILSAIKKMTIKELRNFIFENYYREIGFIKGNNCSMKHEKKKDLLLLATKLIEKKIPDVSNAKKY